MKEFGTEGKKGFVCSTLNYIIVSLIDSNVPAMEKSWSTPIGANINPIMPETTKTALKCGKKMGHGMTSDVPNHDNLSVKEPNGQMNSAEFCIPKLTTF